MDANKYRTAYDKAQAVQHEVWTELCQHLEHAPDAQLLSDYTATLVYTLDKDRREEALRLLRGQLYSRQLRDTGRVESWFTDCGARMGQDIEGFVANARQQYVQAGLAEEQRAEAEAKQKAGRGRFRIRPASAFAPERAAYLVQPYLPRGMVSILGGVSAAGKTSLALDVCARLTRGAAFAPDTPPQPPATGNGRPSAALANAIEALEKQLSFVGWVEAGEVYRLCAERDISIPTMRRARVALGLKVLRVGMQPNQKNYWYRPELTESTVCAEVKNLNQQLKLSG